MKAANSFLSSSTAFNLNHKRNKKHNDSSSIFEWITAETQQSLNRLSGSSEPSIWQKTDSQGQTVWFVYDAETSARETFSSEHAVRIWLESRYNV